VDEVVLVSIRMKIFAADLLNPFGRVIYMNVLLYHNPAKKISPNKHTMANNDKIIPMRTIINVLVIFLMIIPAFQLFIEDVITPHYTDFSVDVIQRQDPLQTLRHQNF
jgi:hypothetical protein